MTDPLHAMHTPRRGKSQPARYPVVYHSACLADFIQHILNNHTAPTTLIICTDRPLFLQQLLHSVQATSTRQLHQKEEITNEQPNSHPAPRPKYPLLTRTLRLLSASKTVNLAFCTSVPTLHAYLSVYPRPPRNSAAAAPNNAIKYTGVPTLALVNPIALHRESASFSAQGLSRAFAAALEAAVRAGQRLVVVESVEGGQQRNDGGAVDLSTDVNVDADGAMVVDLGEGDDGGERRQEDPWLEEVPILNATTKTFGLVADKAWTAGRTVKLKNVVGRWCRFEKLPI